MSLFYNITPARFLGVRLRSQDQIDRIHLSILQANPIGPPIDFYGETDVSGSVSADTRLASDLTRKTDV